MARLAQFWNTTLPEEVAPYAVDERRPRSTPSAMCARDRRGRRCHRVPLALPAPRRAYSYDWIDNEGVAAHALCSGLEELASGKASA
jgi:hypothetical protein